MILVFGDYALDAGRWELRRGDAPVALRPQAMRLLLYLARHRDRVVPRDEVASELWPEEIVSDAALSQVVRKARAAVGDSRKTQRVIKTVQRVGFRFVAPVEEREEGPAAGAPASRRGAAPSRVGAETPTLVGREAVLSDIQAALDEAVRGTGRTILLSGEAGIGKTRLAEAAVECARARGVEVYAGWAHKDGEGRAFWPWLRILTDLVERRDTVALEQALGPYAADLASVVAELGGKLPALPPLPQLDPDQARFRLFQSATVLLKNVAKESPLLLVLEDLHWADPVSLLLLEFLIRELESARLLLLLTYREEETGPGQPLSSTLAELVRHPETHQIRLEGLSRAEVGRFIAALAGIEPDASLVEAVYQRTDGNPFFVKEVVRLLVAERRLGPGGEGESGPTRYAGDSQAWLERIPSAVQLVVSRRVEGFSEPCLHLLHTASLALDEFDFDVLERASDLPADGIVASLEEAAEAHLIEELPDRVGGYRFVHALIRDGLQLQLSALRRAEIHCALGEALEALRAGDPEPHLAELAHHFFEALPVGSAAKALDYAERAGCRATAQLHYEEAALHFGRALELLTAASEPDPRRRFDLLLHRAHALSSGGDRVRAQEWLREAMSIARQRGDGPGFACAAIGYVAQPVSFEDDEPIRVLDEALELLHDGDPKSRVLVAARLAEWLVLHGAVPERAEVLLDEAIHEARQLGDRRALTDVLLSHAHFLRLCRGADLERRIAAADELVEVAEETHDEVRILEAHFRRLGPLLNRGDFEEADREFELFAPLAERLGLPDWLWVLPAYRSTRHMIAGRYGEAEAEVQEVLAVSSRLRHSPGPANYALLLGVLRLEQGRFAELEPFLMQLVDDPWIGLPTRVALAFLRDKIGRRDEARRELDRLAANDFAALRGREGFCFSAAILAELCASFAAGDHATVLYRMLDPYEPWWVTFGEAEVSLGPVARYLGVLAATCSEWEAAEEHFRSALARCEAAGSSPWAAHARFSHAQMLLARGRASDRRRARGLLERALATAQELGMVRLLGEIEALG